MEQSKQQLQAFVQLVTQSTTSATSKARLMTIRKNEGEHQMASLRSVQLHQGTDADVGIGGGANRRVDSEA